MEQNEERNFNQPGNVAGSHEIGNADLRPTPRRPATDSAAALNAKRDQLFADIGVRFTYHPPNETQLPRYAQLRDTAKELAYSIAELTPPSREQALALTHLETAIFFANAAIARNE